jgi:phage major head subunit gpT-like protein
MRGSTAANYDSTSGTLAGGNASSHLWFLIDGSKPIKPFIFQLRQAPEITARMNLQDPAVFDRDVFIWGIRARGAAGYGFWQLAFGSTADLTLANFRSYRATMETYVSDEGFRLGVSPTILLCGPSLRSAAKDLLNRELIPDPTNSAHAATSNAEKGAVQLIVTPHLP